MTRKVDISSRHFTLSPLSVFGLTSLVATLLLLPAVGQRVMAANSHIVYATSATDSNHDHIDDRLEQAVATANYKILPNSVVSPMSAMAETKGMANSSSTVVDLIVCLDHAPTAADTAKFAQYGFTVENSFSRLVYAVHVVGTLPNGLATLQNLANTKNGLGITLIEPNTLNKATLYNSTRQIEARQSWLTFENYNSGLPLTGDPARAICIMDSGIDGTHPDLNGGTVDDPGNKITAWYDAVNGTSEPNDQIGHGSHVAGIAAGTGVMSGLQSGTGFVPVTIAGQFMGNSTAYQEFNDAIPVDTTGYTSNVTMPITTEWYTSYGGGGTNTVNFYDTTGQSLGDAASGSAYAAQQPIYTDVTVPPDTTGTYTFNWLTSSDQVAVDLNESPFIVHAQVPFTSIGDGFNLLSGVAPTSSLVGVAVDDHNEDFSTNAIMQGWEFISEFAQRYNIGVVNMSFGEATEDPVEDAAVNNLVAQGIVCVVAAGNSRSDEDASGDSEDSIGSPATAVDAITVGAVGNDNEITDYSSYGAAGQNKPDVVAPGGIFLGPTEPTKNEPILSVDTNTDDDEEGYDFDQQTTTAGTTITQDPVELFQPDFYPNDYTEEEGTSMAAPHVSGAVALIEQAMDMRGSLGGDTKTGADAAMFIKALLEMTATETNQPADASTTLTTPLLTPPPEPTLDRGGRDLVEGFGKINVDASLEAVLQDYVPGDTATITLGDGPLDPQCWARNVALTANTAYTFSLSGTSSTTTPQDYDLYLYSDSYVGASNSTDTTTGVDGDPVILDSSVNAGTSNEKVSFTPTVNRTVIVVVKRVAGAGVATLTSTGSPETPVAVNVTDTSGNAIPDAIVTTTDSSTSQQLNIATTDTDGATSFSSPVSTSLFADASAFGYFTNGQALTTPAAATSGTPATASTTIQLTASHVFNEGLQMISSPYAYSVPFTSVTTPQIFLAAVWDPATMGYDLTPTTPADTFHLGTGYFVRLKEAVSLNTVGVTAPTGTPFKITLVGGWNMIGEPFFTPTPLSSATVTSTAGKTYTFAAAQTAGLVSVIYEYNTTTGAYQDVAATDSLEPYSGYWIYSNGASSISLSGS